MTQLQKVIKENEQMIEFVGWQLANGFHDGIAEPLAKILGEFIEITDNQRKQQEEAFQQMPWLRKAASK